MYLKFFLDFICALLLLILLFPLFILLSIFISKDGGLPIYGHIRVGKNGKLFKCFKFRSMISNSNEVLQQLLETNEEARAEWEKDFKLKNDPRVTKFGHFIRKTSIDELPQLFNVLLGQMSLVGPRPVTEQEINRYGEYIKFYKAVRPGITGLWQVSGRSNTDYDQRVELDTFYVQNWSLFLDFKILIKTIIVVIKKDGAY